MKTVVKIFYMIQLAIFINLTLVLMLTAFLKPPKSPEYTTCNNYSSYNYSSSYSSNSSLKSINPCQSKMDAYENDKKNYADNVSGYLRNVFIFVTILSMLIGIAGVFLKDISRTVAAATSLGGIFTITTSYGLAAFGSLVSILAELASTGISSSSTSDPTVDNIIKFIICLLSAGILFTVGFLKFKNDDNAPIKTIKPPASPMPPVNNSSFFNNPAPQPTPNNPSTTINQNTPSVDTVSNNLIIPKID